MGGLRFLTAILQAGNTAVCRTVWHSHTKAFKNAPYTTELLGQPEARPLTKISPASLSLVCHCCSGGKLGFQDSPYSNAAAEWLAGDGEGIAWLKSHRTRGRGAAPLLWCCCCQHPTPATFEGTGFSGKAFTGGDIAPLKLESNNTIKTQTESLDMFHLRLKKIKRREQREPHTHHVPKALH